MSAISKFKRRTLGNNAFNANHGTNETGQQLSWGYSPRNKRTSKPNQDLLAFFKVLGIMGPDHIG